MSAITGPNSSLSGLILSLDAASQRSYVSGSTVWYDVSGNGNNGTLVSGSGYSPVNGGAITFDGVDDYVDLGSPLASIMTGASFSSNMWVKSNILLSAANNNFYGLYSCYGPGSIGIQLFWGPTDKLYAAAGRTVVCSTSGSFDSMIANTWYNISFVFNSNASAAIYVNGVNRTSLSAAATVPTPISNFKLGVRSDTNAYSWPGNFSCVSLYNRALSADEIAQNFNSQRFRFGI